VCYNTKKEIALRKRRTRSHIIADLSANHFERHALLCGYSVERMLHDYGVDLTLYTYNEDGEPETDSIKIQLKATDNLPVLKDEQTISFTLLRADLEYWLEEWSPVILVVYDAQNDIAYWLYIQAYFQQRPEFNLTLIGETITVPIAMSQVIDKETIRQFAQFKTNIIQQSLGMKHEII
jgi:hypothetical protein